MTPALRLSGLRIPFGDAPGLEGIGLEVAAGERVAIVGPSGVGKSTLLRAVAGLAPVAGGRVEIGGRDATELPPERRDAVYLHQTPLLFPHLSVAENVAFPLRVRGEGGAAQARVAELLAAVGLVGFERRAPRTLSGGQRHRVALARAIAARPALLLLDEPLASLDPTLREEVRGSIETVQRASGAALLLVTHDLDEAGALGDRIGVLLERRIAQLASPAELFRRPASLAIARFLGIPNRVRGTVGADGIFRSPLGCWSPPEPLPAGAATAVFRPDTVRVVGGPLGGTVLGVRHGAHGAVARVRVGEAELEVAVDPLHPPPVGERCELALDAERTLIFPDPLPR